MIDAETQQRIEEVFCEVLGSGSVFDVDEWQEEECRKVLEPLSIEDRIEALTEYYESVEPHHIKIGEAEMLSRIIGKSVVLQTKLAIVTD